MPFKLIEGLAKKKAMDKSKSKDKKKISFDKNKIKAFKKAFRRGN